MANQKNIPPAQSQKKKIAYVVFGLIILLALIYFVFIQYGEPRPKLKSIAIAGVVLPQAKEINDFNLTDTNGKPFTKENLIGHWTLVFFGFTNCGMICPTTLSALNSMYKIAEHTLAKNQLPQVLFISIDPERDTQSRLAGYVKAFNPNFIGARGEQAETARLMKELKVVVAKMQVDGGSKDQYTLNHSSDILVFNRDAKLQASFSYPHQAEKLAAGYQQLLTAFETTVPNESAQPDLSVQDTMGNRVQWSQLKGHFTVINYWATWCLSCIAEISELNRFYHHRSKNVLLYGVNFDQLSPMQIKQASKKAGIQFPVLMQDPNAAWHLGDLNAVPMTFILGPSGKVVKTIVGPNTEKSLSDTLDNLIHAET